MLCVYNQAEGLTRVGTGTSMVSFSFIVAKREVEKANSATDDLGEKKRCQGSRVTADSVRNRTENGQQDREVFQEKPKSKKHNRGLWNLDNLTRPFEFNLDRDQRILFTYFEMNFLPYFSRTDSAPGFIVFFRSKENERLALSISLAMA